MTNERTSTGRALLQQKRDLDKWIESNRAVAPASDVEAAELLSCELYYAAANGDTSLLRRYSPTSRGNNG